MPRSIAIARRLIAGFLTGMVLVLGLSAPAFGQGTPMPYVQIQLFDNNGDPCAGCLLNAYAAGTTTRQATYSNVTLTSANANPVELDANGRATVYLSATSYRFVLTNAAASVTYFDADNTPSVPTTSGAVDVTGTAGEALSAGDVAYLSDGSGSLTTGRWYKADADNTYSSSTAVQVGIASAAISSGSSGTIRIGGRVTGLTGLTAGETYYVSATAGASTSTPPTNAWALGKADSTTSLVLGSNQGGVVLTDSDGTHSLALRTSSNLTADRLLTLVTGDAARTVTISGDATIGGAVDNSTDSGRLTATSGTCVTTSDVSGATSLYYRPCVGSGIALYDGTSTWNLRTFSEITISVASCVASTPYDIFLYDNATVVTAEILAWTNATTRATALTYQDGVLVKTGATTRRYVAAFYCNASGGQTDDTLAKRYLSTLTNPEPRPMSVTEATNSWNYTTATWRQANGAAGNQLDFMVGWNSRTVTARAMSMAYNTGAGVAVYSAIGLDSTSAPGGIRGQVNTPVAAYSVLLPSFWEGLTGVGRHVLVQLEKSAASGTTTWVGDDGGTDNQTGISGIIWN